MANTECLNFIIGVSPLDCECIKSDLGIPVDGETPEDNDWYKKSTSGFYLHELEGVVSIDTVKDIVSCQKLYDFYKKLLQQSITETADDLSGSLNERYKKKESNFVGFAGSKTSGRVLGLNTQYSGLKVVPLKRKDGVLVVKGIGTNMNVALTFDIEVYRRYVETDLFELVDTIESVQSNAGSYRYNAFEEPMILSMDIENEAEIEYYFLYQNVAELQPRDNLASCGCGSKEHNLAKLMYYGGVSGNVLTEMGNWSMSGNADGLVLDMEIRCDAENMICQMYNANSDWRKYVAHAVLYKAAYKLNKSVISSNKITQEVVANAEIVNGNMNDFEIEYRNRINYLVQNIDLEISGCYTCNDRKLKVQQILL